MAKLTPQQFMHQAQSMARSFPSTVTDAVMLSARAAEEHFDESFDKEGFKDNGRVKKWKPLRASTIKRKGHDRILHRTGKLRKSQNRILYSSGGKQGARITYGAKYAALQNDGFIHKNGKKVAARKFIGGSGVLNRKIRKVFLAKMKQHFTTRYYIGR